MKKSFTLLSMLGYVWMLQACQDDTSSSGNSFVVEGDFSVAFVQRNLDAIGNPTDGEIYSPGGELLMKDLSSPSSETVNITGDIVQGPHDVSDPEVSYDGKRLLFSMQAPQWQNNTTWNIFEYDIEGKTLTRLVVDDTLANAGDDTDPAYLPDGRIVFSSNRQKGTREKMVAEGKVQPYAYRDEYEREASMVLHVLDPSLQKITQISFNQSHDRNPTVLMSGQIMFARWDHVANRNHFPLFTTDPDGTNIFVQYGAFSPGNSYLHPREMSNGKVMTSLMPLSGTDEGGPVMIVDVKNYTDNSEPANNNVTGNGQVQTRPDFPVTLGREFSENGRYTTPYPLWDGTNRALVAFKANPKLEDAEVQMNPMTGEEEPVENPPRYGIYMLDMDTDQLRPIALPDAGADYAYTDPIAIIPRDENCPVSLPNGCMPAAVADDNLAGTLADQEMGILNVKSIYDTDNQNLMNASVLIAGEDIPTTNGKPNLIAMKTPGTAEFMQRVGRFVRVTRAVPTPPGISMELIGESDFEMQEILGYAPIEPDGSLRVMVPADTPLTLAVVDSEGRALQTHTNWLQVRPGETRTCNGCHSPRRGSAINGPGVAGTHNGANSGETMAETRTRLLVEAGHLDVPAMPLTEDMVETSYWEDGDDTADKTIDYAGLDIPPVIDSDGVITINYPDHIQPLWDKDRGANTCTDCHNSTSPANGLDLSGSVGGFGRLTSYQELMLGDPILGPNGLPIITIDDDGEVMMAREAPLVSTGSSRQSSRTSHLMEKLYEQELRAPQSLEPPTVNHKDILNPSELRLVAEWIDIGAQYYNDPFDDTDGFKELSETRGGLQGLDEDFFDNNVHPVLLSRCASCHQAFGATGALPDLSAPNAQFVGSNRFVLTGNPSGDFNVTVGMVTDVCAGENNELLLRPTSDSVPPNPAHPLLGPNTPVLDMASSEYGTILTWITMGAAANNCP